MASANRFLDKSEDSIDRKDFTQFNAVGQIDTINKISGYVLSGNNATVVRGTGTSTAFLVSPCYALTNAHSIFGPIDTIAQPETEIERAKVGEDYKVKFSVGIGATLPFAGNVTARPVAWGDWGGGPENDWALLKLSSCLGKRPEIGWMPLDANEHSDTIIGQDVAVLSYPADSATGRELKLSHGNVRSYDRKINAFRYDATTWHGSSGGAVIMKKGDGRLVVVGLHQGGDAELKNLEEKTFSTYTDEHANHFILSSDILASQNIRQLLVDDIMAYGKGNPNSVNLVRGWRPVEVPR